jgi:hypothetical protein
VGGRSRLQRGAARYGRGSGRGRGAFAGVTGACCSADESRWKGAAQPGRRDGWGPAAGPGAARRGGAAGRPGRLRCAAAVGRGTARSSGPWLPPALPGSDTGRRTYAAAKGGAGPPCRRARAVATREQGPTPIRFTDRQRKAPCRGSGRGAPPRKAGQPHAGRSRNAHAVGPERRTGGQTPGPARPSGTPRRRSRVLARGRTSREGRMGGAAGEAGAGVAMARATQGIRTCECGRNNQPLPLWARMN